jgi:hypothetical protein
MDERLTLKQLILQKIESKEYTVKELAPIAGYTEKYAQNFKRALVEDREFDNFQGIIDVIEYIWKDRVVELMSQFSYEINVNKKNARCMLEWLSVNRQLTAFKSLIDRMENCSNKESREWSRAYSIQYYGQINFPSINFDDIIKQVKEFKTGIPELKVFLKILKTHAYHQKGNYFMTRILAEEIDSYMIEIENEYIVNSYSNKLSEIMTWIELRVFNRPDKCRYYADRIIESNVSKPFKAFANFQKGYSYFFTSYEDTVYYFGESLKLYKEINSKEWVIKDMEEKIEFAKVYWGKLEKKECYNEKNYFLMNIKNGVNVGKLLDEYSGDKIDNAMLLFLKGYNDKNYVTLVESALEFVRKGDTYLSNLPRNALLEMNYKDTHLVDKLMSIREEL